MCDCQVHGFLKTLLTVLHVQLCYLAYLSPSHGHLSVFESARCLLYRPRGDAARPRTPAWRRSLTLRQSEAVHCSKPPQDCLLLAVRTGVTVWAVEAAVLYCSKPPMNCLLLAVRTRITVSAVAEAVLYCSKPPLECLLLAVRTGVTLWAVAEAVLCCSKPPLNCLLLAVRAGIIVWVGTFATTQ